jgi:streptomycin 6-kinase
MNPRASAASIRIPTHLARTVESRGQSGRKWVAALPPLLERLANEWSLAIGDPYEPGGGTSWTAPVVRSTDGQRLVLKIGLRDHECLHEAEGLRVWDGDGTVRLHQSWSNKETTALLLERCEPGTELWSGLAEPEQDLVVAQLLQRLWVEPPNPNAFRPLADMCAYWAAECEERTQRSPPPDVGLVREGLAVWRELPTTEDRRVLLVTDLHGGNILAAQREPWLVVDPKPYVGDPAYDPMQHMTNCSSRLAADPVGLCNRMATLTGVDARRLRLWMFARLIVDSGWPFDSVEASTNFDVARRLAS